MSAKVAECDAKTRFGLPPIAEGDEANCHDDNVMDVIPIDEDHKDVQSSRGEDEEEEEMLRHLKKKDGVMHVMDNLPKRLYILRNLWEYLENNLGVVPSQYLVGKYLDKGGIHVWLHESIRLNKDVRQLPEGVILKEVNNRKKEASKSVLVLGVPLHFPEENFHEYLRDVKEIIRWNPSRGKVARTSIVEIIFYKVEDAQSVLKYSKLVMDGIRYNVEPKFLSRAKVCRSCKKINPDHSPHQCTTIRCGVCAGKHSTKDHESLMDEKEKEMIKCPACAGDHIFNKCPVRAKEIKRSMKDQQRSYKDALTKRDRREFERPVKSTEPMKGVLTVEELMANPAKYIQIILNLFQKLQELLANGVMLNQPEASAPSEKIAVEHKITKRPRVVATVTIEQNQEGKYVCPKKCGIPASKTSGPIQKHLASCNGEDYQKQLKNKKADSRSTRVEASNQKEALKHGDISMFLKKTSDSL